MQSQPCARSRVQQLVQARDGSPRNYHNVEVVQAQVAVAEASGSNRALSTATSPRPPARGLARGSSHASTSRRQSVMSEQVEKSSFTSSGPFRAIVAVVLLAALGVGVWWWMTRDRESTDDAQVDTHVIPIGARTGGSVVRVPVVDNQVVDAGAVLVEIDPRDYQVAVDKARAELADAEAAAIAAQSNVPITSTTAASNVGTAQDRSNQAARSCRRVSAGHRSGEKPAGRRTGASARSGANADPRRARPSNVCGVSSPRRGLSQQQFDAAVAASRAQKRHDTARAQNRRGRSRYTAGRKPPGASHGGRTAGSRGAAGTQTAPDK